MKMLKLAAILIPGVVLLPMSAAALGACSADAPEIGDIGPASERVCADLERLFAGAQLAVADRGIHSPTAVSVYTVVNGAPLPMRYELVGYRWQLAPGIAAGDAFAEIGAPRP